MPNWGDKGDRTWGDCLWAASPLGSPAAHARPRPLGLAATPWSEFFSRAILQDSYEAAHMPSCHLTEPMRCRDWSRPQTPTRAALDAAETRPSGNVTLWGSSSLFCLARMWHGQVSGPRPETWSPSGCGNATRPEPAKLFGAASFCDAPVSQSESEMPLLNHAGAARVVWSLRKPFEGSG